MSVTQLAEHVAQHLEELVLVHLVAYAYLIFIVCLIPVEPVFLLLVVEETIVLVDNLPECLEVARRRIGAFFGVYARN